MGRNARDVNDRRWRLAHSMILYCLPGKAWVLGLSYPWTSSLNPGLHPGLVTLRYMASSRRSCQTTVVLFNTETQRLQRFSSRGSTCLLWLYPWTSSLTHWTSSQFLHAPLVASSRRCPGHKVQTQVAGLSLPELTVSAVVIIYA